ncbi:hypothetical protein NLX83_07570 [Allokutzneria sp. A3M-2-11 16]|uniref:hypothetical protein n=1 Tax=Allokutzneria sp. A3M-2-11 16 TaxID=2962043 RepID=UPI0020B6E7FA|nr:hypothetical protein [Allokutzneria sp. A3M-2-11 16]MCP3799111.1 hypothetical protein [Allokutzneria sp. A3M-2-11 16]
MSDRKLAGVHALQELWCQPGESILCCLWSSLSGMSFAVPGLAPDGISMPSLGKQALSDLGEFFNGFFADERPDSLPVPGSFVFGPSTDSYAVRLVLNLREQQADTSCWVFTPSRIAGLKVVRAPVPKKAEPPVGLGISILKAVKETVNTLTGNYSSSGYLVDELRTTERVDSVLEICPHEVIRVGTTTERFPSSYSQREATYVRIGFADGSGLAFNTALGIQEKVLR